MKFTDVNYKNGHPITQCPRAIAIRDAVNQWYLNAVQTELIDKDKVTLIKSAFLQAWNHELEPDDPQLYNKKASEIAIRKRRPWATAAYTLMIYTKRAIWNALTPRLYEDDPKIIAKLQKNPTPGERVGLYMAHYIQSERSTEENSNPCCALQQVGATSSPTSATSTRCGCA